MGYSKKTELMLLAAFQLSVCSCSSSGGGDPADAGGGDEVRLLGDVSVSDDDARSCDLKLVLGGDLSSVEVRFHEKISGRFQNRYPLLTVSISSTEDEPMTNEVFGVFVRSDGEQIETGSLSVKEAVCYDQQGRRLEHAGVEIR